MLHSIVTQSYPITLYLSEQYDDFRLISRSPRQWRVKGRRQVTCFRS